jgi:MOSC domain-containing protein YiiM
MNHRGSVISIHLAQSGGAPVKEVAEVRAVAGKGLDGDRYSNGSGTYSKPRHDPAAEATLIESEALEALKRDYGIALAPGASRRNIMTRGIALNDLVGREFTVGTVRFRGIRLCEPCAHLQKLTSPGIMRGLAHRGGLNAEILTDGVIRVGDFVEAKQTAEVL